MVVVVLSLIVVVVVVVVVTVASEIRPKNCYFEYFSFSDLDTFV